MNLFFSYFLFMHTGCSDDEIVVEPKLSCEEGCTLTHTDPRKGPEHIRFHYKKYSLREYDDCFAKANSYGKTPYEMKCDEAAIKACVRSCSFMLEREESTKNKHQRVDN